MMLTKKCFLFVLGLLFLDKIYAQLCQGSLGDPVVNITFGSGTNTGPALSPSVISYEYVSDFCPNDGYYTIANSTENCFGNTWLTLSEDHTPGDNNGYMIVANASVSAGDFYVQEVTGLCSRTTYEFAAWLVNVIRPSACGGNIINPNITFTIETTGGQILQSYSTGDISTTLTPAWKQYGVFFDTPEGVSTVVIRITNNAPGGCGNDLALDDITFRPCGPKVSVKVNNVDSLKEVCTGDTATFTFASTITGGYANTFFQWQKSSDLISWTDIVGANSSTYSTAAIITPGKYYFRLSVAEGNNAAISSCRIASDFVTINVNPLPVAAASNSGPVCEGKNITLTGMGGAVYLWTGPGNFSSNVQSPVIVNALANTGGLYYVKVTSQSGCVSNDSTRVEIKLNPVADAGTSVDICEGTTTQLQGSTPDTLSHRWTPAEGLSDPAVLNPFASPAKTTSFTLTVADGVCTGSDSVVVSVLKKPVANAGPDKAIVSNQRVKLEGQVTGSNVTYFWTPDFFISSDSVLNPTVAPPSDTSYVLTAVSNIGCGTSTDKVLVRYFKDIYVPNAFTPNNDGLNDRWNLPVLPAFPLAEVRVYNRYGQLIFFDIGYTKQWDGTFKGIAQPAGVYTYVIDLKNGLKKLFGTVTLLR